MLKLGSAIGLALLCTATAIPSAAQQISVASGAPAASVKPSAALDQRVGELPGVIAGTTAAEAFFSPSFLANVSKEKFAATNAQLTQALGALKGVRLVSAETPYSGTIEVQYERRAMSMQINVDPQAPHLVTGLRVGGASAAESTLGAVAAAFAAQPGIKAMTISRLDKAGPTPVLQLNADSVLAIGSEFKLIILAELIRGVNAGERSWDDQVTLGGQALPAGAYAKTAKGTKVTLRELAEKMISVSDNSATDILLKALGREKVEAMLPVVGIADPARNKPFLSTLEAFKLKGQSDKNYGAMWKTLDEAGKRALLAGELAEAVTQVATPPSTEAQASAAPAPRKPKLIDTVEWFASPADMVRVMDWLRRNTESGPGSEARAILAKNPGAPSNVASRWSYVGFKGGSEPGVIAATFLLQGKDGRWYAVSAALNNTEAEVDQNRFLGLVSRAMEIVAPK